MKKRRTLGSRRVVRQQSPTEDEDTVELAEICTRLNRIIERSNRLDQQLSEIEKKKKNMSNVTEIETTLKQTPQKISPIRTSERSSSVRKTKTIPAVSASASRVEREPSRTRTRPVMKSATRRKDITLEVIYDEIVALRKEVAAIAATQEEMKRQMTFA